MFEWAEGLNPAQAEAVGHDGGPLLVVAGAGTGKTKTLSCRVARLVAEGTPPERILLLTFSRRAAREMLERAARLTGVEVSGRAWGGTFHAVAYRLLRRHGRHVGLADGFTVIDQGDAADLLGLIRADLGFGQRGRRFPKKETLAAVYSRTVNAQVPLRTALAKWFPWCAHDADDVATAFDAYLVRKRAQNIVDYDDLLLYWRALLAPSPAADAVAEQFDHVLVDEYQDTNAVQADILQALARHQQITAVGDDAQAIYSFRAAGSHGMAEFPARFPGTRIVALEQNYRSTQPILDAANAVMAAAPAGYPKHLWSQRAGGVRPVLLTCADDTAEAAAVCDLVLEQCERGVALRDQAVLFRTGHHSDALEVELARRHIPFVKYGGLRFLEAAHVKDALALLRMVENPADELAWNRVLLLLEGVGPATARRLLDELRADVAIIGPLGRLLADPPSVPSSATDDLARLRSALATCVVDPEPPAAAQLDALMEFLAPVVRRRYDGAGARLADLEQLQALAGPLGTRARFLAEITLDPPVSTSDLAGPPLLDDDFLILSTIHSAKGGEWRSVYVIHAADGCLPSDMALTDADGAEEERRLLYVALTRARDTLYVSFPQRFYHRRDTRSDAHSYALASRFLVPAATAFDTATAAGPGPVAGLDDIAGPGPLAVADPVGELLAGLFRDA